MTPSVDGASFLAARNFDATVERSALVARLSPTPAPAYPSDVSSAILVVEKEDRVRASIRHAISSRGLPVYEVTDAFDAMSALGRADFGAIVVSAGKRQLSLRGLCQLARRRHPNILIFIIFFEGAKVGPVEEALGVPFEVVPPGTTTTELAARIDVALKSNIDAFDITPHTLDTNPNIDAIDLDIDEFEPTVRNSKAPTHPADARTTTEASRSASVSSMTASTAMPSTSMSTPSMSTSSLPHAAVTATEAPMPVNIRPITAPRAALFVEDDVEQTEPHVVAPRFSTLSGPPAADLSDADFSDSGEFVKPPAVVEAAAATNNSSPHRAPMAPETVDALFDARAPELSLPPLPALPARAVAPSVVDELNATTVVTPGAFPRVPTETERYIPASSSPSTAEDEPLFEGTLEERAGPTLLMSLMAQEFNGRLEITDAGPASTIFFFGGEPVWATPTDGDHGLLQRLVEKRIVAPLSSPPTAPEGQLLTRLVAAGMLTGSAMHDFMRAFIRDAVIAFSSSTTGAYTFFESSAFIDTIPLVKVNSFGLILEARRRRTPPDEILRTSSELEWKYMHPGPALAPAAPKLKAFVRSADLQDLVNGQRRVRMFLEKTGLDAIMGSLVVLTLVDARLMTLHDEPQTELPTVALSDSTQVDAARFAIPDSDIADGTASKEEGEAREEIFTLYMQLKPLSAPTEVLGVPRGASREEARAAFQRRMAALDPARIPEGSARALMVSRVEELRYKVTFALEQYLENEPSRPR